MYKATVNNNHLFELESNQNTSSVNQTQVDFDCKMLPSGEYHILLDNTSLVAKAVHIDRNEKKVELMIEGKTYSVKLEDDFDLLLTRMGMDASASQKESEVKSPMPGLVLDVKVEVGQSVTKDDALMVLEAMKMENVIAAPGDAVIASIEVSPQDKVDKNQVLIRFE